MEEADFLIFFDSDARAAIRGVFHDCFPQGGCDGSLAIFAEELTRTENVPMAPTMAKLKALAGKYNVSVADTLMFAGCKLTLPFRLLFIIVSDENS